MTLLVHEIICALGRDDRPRLVDSLEILAHALDPEALPLPLGLPAPTRVIDSAPVNRAS
jgi:hypothetical protein